MLVRNRLQNHAYYGDEAFAGDSVGLGLGQRLDFIFKTGTFGAVKKTVYMTRKYSCYKQVVF